MEMRRSERPPFPGFRLAGFRCLIDLSEAGRDPEIAMSRAGFLGKKRTSNKLQAWSNAAISRQRGGPFTDKSHELSNFQLDLSPELVTGGSGLSRSCLLACLLACLHTKMCFALLSLQPRTPVPVQDGPVQSF